MILAVMLPFWRVYCTTLSLREVIVTGIAGTGRVGLIKIDGDPDRSR